MEALTDQEQSILEEFKRWGKLVLAGNREYYEILEVMDGKIIHHGGDTMENKEEYRYEIADKKVVELLVRHFKREAEIYGQNPLRTEEEVYEYMQKEAG